MQNSAQKQVTKTILKIAATKFVPCLTIHNQVANFIHYLSLFSHFSPSGYKDAQTETSTKACQNVVENGFSQNSSQNISQQFNR